MSAITVEHLTKRYGDLAAVDDVSFDVPTGSLVAVLGPNGAGKTTTIETLEGFTAPTGGIVRVLGADPRRAGREWRAQIGLVLQSTSLDAATSVGDLLALFAGLYPDPRPVPEVLDLVDLSDEAGTRIGSLSGGQRRRVDVALGIVGRPEVLFLDEPTTGLDPEARRRVWATVTDLRSTGTTVLLTTHYLEEAAAIADRLLVLFGGQVVADTDPDTMRARNGVTTIRFPVPPMAPIADLPAALARYYDAETDTLLIRSTDPSPVLAELVRWADRSRLDLTGLEVGPPSLEDAYLDLIGPRLTEEPLAHV